MKKIYQLVLLMCISTGVYANDYRTITVTGTVSSSQIPSIAIAGDSFTATFTYNQTAIDSNNWDSNVGYYYNTASTEEGVVLTIGNNVIKSDKSISESLLIEVVNRSYVDNLLFSATILEAPYNLCWINWEWTAKSTLVFSSDTLPTISNLNTSDFDMNFTISESYSQQIIVLSPVTYSYTNGITTGLDSPIPTGAATISETKATGSIQGEKLVLSGCSLNSKVDVYSVNGVSLLSTTYSGSEIDLSRLPKGVYITHIVATNGEPTVFKILKK